jgi:hypothetical protein
MSFFGKCLLIGGVGALALCAGTAASAQDNASGGTNAVGAPALRDFQLPGSRRIVAQPPANQPPVIQVAPPSPVTGRPVQAERPRPGPARPTGQTQRPAGAQAQPQQQVQPQSQPSTALPAPGPTTAPPPSSLAPAPVEAPAQAPAAVPPAPQAPTESSIPWIYVLPALAGLLVVGLALFRRRRRASEIQDAVEEAVEAKPPPPKPVPVARPWLELELKAEKAQSTNTEAVVEFELEIINNGKAPARNIRIDVKMFNAGQSQEQEIGAFFRSAGRESTKCHLPGIAPDTTGVIRGSVTMPRDEMKALLLKDRYLFVPVIAVNALYDWGEGQTGQTSKSYVVGRELEQPGEKMGAFRVDQGPRVWRTVGQRQHKLARRV